jgi:hypothetical protein
MVYVDDMRAGFGRMVMCHMIADTDHELHTMAAVIGVARRWHQSPGPQSHYDICLGMRARAIKSGAIAITQKECGCMTMRRRVTGELGAPEVAVEWALAHLREKRLTALN